MTVAEAIAPSAGRRFAATDAPSSPHFLVFVQVQYARAACGFVMKPGAEFTGSAKLRCTKCADALHDAVDRLPSECDEPQAFVVAQIRSTLKPGFREAAPHVFVPVRMSLVATNNTKSKNKNKRAKAESDTQPLPEPDETPAEEESPIETPDETPVESPAETLDAPVETPVEETPAVEESPADEQPAVEETPAAETPVVKPKRVRKSKTTAAPAAETPAPVSDEPVDVEALTAARVAAYAAWKNENNKLVKLEETGLSQDDAKYLKQYARMRNASKAYRTAKAAENAAQ